MTTRQKGPKARATNGRPCWATVIRGETGYAAVAATAHGLVASTGPQPSEAAATEMLRREFGEPVLRRSCADAEWMPAGRGLPPHLAAARDAFGAYMRGDNDALGCLQLDTRGRSPFTARVLEIVKGIPAGQVMSYGEVATAAGRPGGARAVGQTMARNVLAPVVPCHRVIAAGGGLGGFGSGLPRKMALLEQEGVSIDATAQKVAGRK